MNNQTDNRDYPNSGVLFANDRKTGERSADLKGSGTLDCPHCGQRVELWLNAWRKVGQRAGSYLSLSLRPKTGGAMNTAGAGRDLADVFPPGDRNR